MPYYVFSVKPFAQYTRLAEFAAFRDASAHAKMLRGALAAGSGEQIKLMFADDETQAVDLMCQPRDAAPAGDE